MPSSRNKYVVSGSIVAELSTSVCSWKSGLGEGVLGFDLSGGTVKVEDVHALPGDHSAVRKSPCPSAKIVESGGCGNTEIVVAAPMQRCGGLYGVDAEVEFRESETAVDPSKLGREFGSNRGPSTPYSSLKG